MITMRPLRRACQAMTGDLANAKFSRYDQAGCDPVATLE